MTRRTVVTIAPSVAQLTSEPAALKVRAGRHTQLLVDAFPPPLPRAVWTACLSGHDGTGWTRPGGLHVLARWVRSVLAPAPVREESV